MSEDRTPPEHLDADGELVRLMIDYQGGSVTAFEQLYLALAADLRRFFEAATGDAAVAQDLAQEAFLEIHRSRRTYRAPLPVRPWVFGIARHVRDRQRRAAWRRERNERQGAAVSCEPQWLPGTFSLAGEGASLEAQDIEEALRRLPPSRRHAWVLHHVHGLSFAQVGAQLRIGTGAARLRSSRAMKALRKALGIPAKRAEDD